MRGSACHRSKTLARLLHDGGAWPEAAFRFRAIWAGKPKYRFRPVAEGQKVRFGALTETEPYDRAVWFADLVGSDMIGGMKDWIAHFRAAATGLVVAHVWRGYGSALFMEFGALSPSTLTRKDGTLGEPSGEIGLMIQADWRIEGTRTIECGSSSDEELWERAFARLIGQHVTDITTFGRLPEVLISLSNDLHIASFSTLEGDPEWALFDRRGPAGIVVGCWSGAIYAKPASPA